MIETLPPIREYTGARADATERLLVEIASGSRGRSPRRRRTVAWISGLAVAGVAVAGVAVVKDAFAPAVDRTVVRCHTTTDIGRHEDFVGTSTSMAVGTSTSRPDAGGIVTIDWALEACADLYRQGVLVVGSAQPGAPEPGKAATVPPLVGCVDGDGLAAVFPGGKGLCASLGLATLVEVR